MSSFADAGKLLDFAQVRRSRQIHAVRVRT